LKPPHPSTSAYYAPAVLDLDTAILMPFTGDHFKLKFGVSHEYNSQPQLGLERRDTAYYANLVIQLKNFAQ